MWSSLLGSDGIIRIPPFTYLLSFSSGISRRLWSRDLWPKQDWIPITWHPVCTALWYLSRSVDSGYFAKRAGQCVRRPQVVDFTKSFVRLLCSSTPLSGGF